MKKQTDGQEKKALPTYKTMEEFVRAQQTTEKDAPLPPEPDLALWVCRIFILTILLELGLVSVYFLFV